MQVILYIIFSGILDILSELQVVETMILRENLITENGIRSFMLPVNVKKSSLQELVVLDLRENRIKSLDCKWFDGLTKLKTLYIDPIKQLYSNRTSIGPCRNPSEHIMKIPVRENQANEMALEIFSRLMKVEKTAKTNVKKSNDDYIVLCSVHPKPDNSIVRKRKNIIAKPAAKKGRFKM